MDYIRGMLSMKEADRLAVIEEVVEKRLRQGVAAQRLGLSIRQVKRLALRYRAEGPAGLASRRRGKRPGNTIDADLREEIMVLVRERYADFGPTLACEKLAQAHGYRVSVESLRQWMMAEGLWRAKVRRQLRLHPPRLRRECCGDLVQIDGSPHAWFEDRGPRCSLLVFIDDATGRLMATGFYAEETMEAYMAMLRCYLAAHGRPVALYSDRHSVFRVNRRDCEGHETQFTRALKTLDIASVHASSPQAKGRVERANRTLQDRWVKEMRLRGIHTMAAANACLPTLMEDFNRRFAVPPRNAADAHRAVLHDANELDLILCEQHRRKLTKELTIQFECQRYQVTGEGKGYRLRGAEVTVCQAFDGSVRVLLEGRELSVKRLCEDEMAALEADAKTVRGRVEWIKAAQLRRPAWKPAPDHPWRRPFLSNAPLGGRM